MKILVTGRNGLLGAQLIKFLKQENFYVEGIDVDIRNKRNLDRFVNKFSKINWIIHTLAITDTKLCEKNRTLCFDYNVEGTRNIRDIAFKKNSRLIFTSTSSVFSGEEGDYKENDLPYPKNFYNLSKVIGEQIVLDYENSLIIRMNLIGSHKKSARNLNFFEWLLEAFKKNRDISLYKNVYINPLSNITLSRLIGRLINMYPKEKILHLGSRNILSKADIGRIVLKTFPKYKGTIKYTRLLGKEGNFYSPQKAWLNVDFVQNKIGLEMPLLESEINLLLTEK